MLHQFLLKNAADCRTLIRSRWRTGEEKNFNEWMQTFSPERLLAEEFEDKNAPRTNDVLLYLAPFICREIIKAAFISQGGVSLMFWRWNLCIYIFAVIQLCVHAILIMREIVLAWSLSLACLVLLDTRFMCRVLSFITQFATLVLSLFALFKWITTNKIIINYFAILV